MTVRVRTRGRDCVSKVCNLLRMHYLNSCSSSQPFALNDSMAMMMADPSIMPTVDT